MTSSSEEESERSNSDKCIVAKRAHGTRTAVAAKCPSCTHDSKAKQMLNHVFDIDIDDLFKLLFTGK